MKVKKVLINAGTTELNGGFDLIGRILVEFY